MSLLLDKVDAAPVFQNNFTVQFDQWISNLVDTLNEDISDINSVVMSVNVVSAITQTVELNSRYIPTNVALTTFQLPVTAPVGARVTIAGQGAGGWVILTAAGQTIQLAAVPATAAVSVASSSRYDSIEIICVVENTTWVTLSTQTTGFVIV